MGQECVQGDHHLTPNPSAEVYEEGKQPGSKPVKKGRWEGGQRSRKRL